MWAEFFGPPGVGKSTTFRALFGQVSLATCTTLGSADSLTDPDWIAFRDHAGAAFRRAMEHNPKGASWRWQNFQRKFAQAIGAAGSRRLVLLDDLLLQRGQSLAAAEGHDVDIERFYQLVPPPTLTVVLRADAETIRARNKHRAAKGGSDLSTESERALEVVNLAMPILQARGFRLLELDAMQPVSANVAAIKAALQEAA